MPIENQNDGEEKRDDLAENEEEPLEFDDVAYLPVATDFNKWRTTVPVDTGELPDLTDEEDDKDELISEYGTNCFFADVEQLAADAVQEFLEEHPYLLVSMKEEDAETVVEWLEDQAKDAIYEAIGY